MRCESSLLVISVLMIAGFGHSSGHLVKLNDKFVIKDTELFIKDSANTALSEQPVAAHPFLCVLRKLFNPLFWLQKFFELIPETAFWLLGVDNYDCRYLTICQTSNYLINNAPKFMSSMLKGSHTGILSTILGETPYIEAWSIGSIKSIECPLLYNCPKPPFTGI